MPTGLKRFHTDEAKDTVQQILEETRKQQRRVAHT
jgi:hypothetical protein